MRVANGLIGIDITSIVMPGMGSLNMKHLIQINWGILAVVLSVMDISNPKSQLIIEGIAIGVALLGAIFSLLHLKMAKEKFFVIIELVLFATAIMFAVTAIVDVTQYANYLHA